MGYEDVKSKDWGTVKVSDVFKYVYEDRDIYIGICDSINEEGDVVVSDVYEVIGDGNMDFGFHIGTSLDDRQGFKLIEILFHHVTPLDELKEKFPELTI